MKRGIIIKKNIILISIVITMIFAVMSLAACDKDDEINCFILTVSVEHLILEQGEDFIVSVELKNNGEKDKKIAKYFLFSPEIYGQSWIIDRVPPPWPTFEYFESGSTIKRTINLGSYFDLPVGLHNLQVRAVFFLNWEPSENSGIPGEIPVNAQKIDILSNIIELTVK